MIDFDFLLFFSVVIITLLDLLKKIANFIFMVLLYEYSKNQKNYRKFVQLAIGYNKIWPSMAHRLIF